MDLKPPSPDELTDIVVVVDLCTRLIEITALINKVCCLCDQTIS